MTPPARSGTPPPYQALEVWLERLDRLLLLLAAVSVGLYLAELRGVWAARGLDGTCHRLSLAIDCLFLADLLLKPLALGPAYLLSPWFCVDLISTLPILGTAAVLPEYLEGLRILRGLRFFRVLRTLRVLRVMRTLRLFQFLKTMPGVLEEGKAFQRALYASVLVYAASFVWLMSKVHGAWPPGPAQDDIEFYAVLASLLAMALVLVVVRFQIPDLAARQIRMILNIALPYQVAEHFVLHPESYDRTVRMPATIVFSDIHGFTATVEALGSDLTELKAHLERVLDAVVDAHQRYDLIVDKFIGDAVMSFRGGDLVSGTPEEHAWRVVRASLDSVRAVRELHDKHFKGMKVGGASAEACLIGAFGTSRRLSYTVLGDAVNLAARLEPASGQVGAANLFCERTFRLTRGRNDIVWRCLGRVHAPGKKGSERVYEAFDAAELKERGWLEVFREALAAFEGRRIADAARLFAEADSMREGGDGPSKAHMKLCEGLRDEGLPDGWEPIIETRK